MGDLGPLSLVRSFLFIFLGGKLDGLLHARLGREELEL